MITFSLKNLASLHQVIAIITLNSPLVNLKKTEKKTKKESFYYSEAKAWIAPLDF